MVGSLKMPCQCQNREKSMAMLSKQKPQTRLFIKLFAIYKLLSLLSSIYLRSCLFTLSPIFLEHLGWLGFRPHYLYTYASATMAYSHILLYSEARIIFFLERSSHTHHMPESQSAARSPSHTVLLLKIPRKQDIC